MSDDLEKGRGKIIEARDHLREAEQRAQKWAEVLPEIQRQKEMYEWAADAVEGLPQEAIAVVPPEFGEVAEQGLRQLKTFVPLPPLVDREVLAVTSASTTTSAVLIVSNMVHNVGLLQSSKALEYAHEQEVRLRKLQEDQKLAEEVRRLANERLPLVVPRLDEANRAYENFRANIANATDAANAIRNLVNGLRGRLEERAKRWPTENMTPELMRERLFTNSPTRAEVERQFEAQPGLIGDLSAILKGMNSQPPHLVHGLWSRVLGHVRIILIGLQSG